MTHAAFYILLAHLGVFNDAARLSPMQQETFQRVATQEFCGCESALTLAGCLDKRPNCRLATQLGQVLVRGLEAGASGPQLEGLMSQEALGPYCAPAIALQTDGAPRKGKAKGAPITIVEFADFRCTHCREAVPMVHKVVQDYANKVQLIYMPISLQDAEESIAAGEAALAANTQGKFWEMHAALFAREQGDFTPAVLSEIAKKVGLNIKQFDKEMASHRHRDTLAKWRKMALDAGLQGTPAFFINGRRFTPIGNVFTLEHRLDMEAERSQTECK